MSEVLSFDLTTETIQVEIGGEDYELREATGAGAKAYENAQLSSIQHNADGSRTIVDAGSIAGLLLSHCLFKKNDNGSFARVSSKVIEGWPNRIREALFKKAKEISGIGQDTDLTVSRLLLKALNHEEAPCSFDSLKEWVNGLHEETEDEWRPLKVFLESEEVAKKS